MLEIILINGLVTGGVYALMAAGFSLIFGVAKIFNMAHTAFYMLTAFLVYFEISYLRLPYLLSAILAVFAISISGMLCYKFLFDRVKVHQTAVMIISLAVAVIFQEVLLLIFGGDYRGVRPFVVGFVNFLGVSVLYQHLFVIIGCFITLFGIWILLAKTYLGKAIRAISEDQEIANVMGIDVSRVCLITMGISVGLVSVACVLAVPLESINPSMWVQSTIMILGVVVLGGLGDFKGSVLAAIIIGYAETIVITLVPAGSFLRSAVSLITIVVVLFFRPEGILGVVFEEERL